MIAGLICILTWLQSSMRIVQHFFSFLYKFCRLLKEWIGHILFLLVGYLVMQFITQYFESTPFIDIRCSHLHFYLIAEFNAFLKHVIPMLEEGGAEPFFRPV